MNKKEAFIPLAFIALSVLFVAVSIMVFISNGKSKKWVARKMKIGGLLLSIYVYSCNNLPEPIYTCYVRISLYDLPKIYNEKIEISLDSNKIIYGNITGGYREEYSYSLVDKNGKIIQKDNILVKHFNTDFDDFIIVLDSKLDKGNFKFKLYRSNTNEQDSTQLVHEQEFIIKDE